MQTANIPQNQIAIVGIDAYFNAYKTLDAFERAIYEGQPIFEPPNNKKSILSSTEITQKLERIINNALEDAAIHSEVKTAIVVANREQKLDNNAKSYINTDSVFNALLIAKELLNKCQAEAVVVAGIDFNTQKQAAGAVVLKRHETAQEDRVYAIIDTLESIAVNTKVATEEIAYLEVISDHEVPACADRLLAEVEIDSIESDLNSKPTDSCAVSSINHASGIAAEIASLIKTALCIHYRYIPSVTQWNQPANPEIWQKSPFYIAASAKPWFLESRITRRVAVIANSDHAVPRLRRDRQERIILAEALKPQQRSNAYLEQTPHYLYPLAAPDEATLLQQLNSLQQKIAHGDIAQTARQTFIEYRQSKAHLSLAIVGKNRAEILKECDRATQGITKAFATGKDWQTPVGSYFTANPLGQKGKVAYVYPGAYNAHLEIGKNLFRLFPNLIDDPVIKSTCDRVANIEKLLYPRSIHKLSPRELEAKERELINDALAMLESETGFAGLITTILRDCFQIKPQGAFGYSQGEISMMYAQGVWSDIGRTSNVINTSELFKTRLAGSKDAVREYWQNDIPQGELWRTYVVMAKSKDIAEKLQTENRVYLTQISTETECVIAGDPQSCERVITSLDCDAFRAPFNHVIHCEALKSEYDELIKLNTLPLRNTPTVNFYSAAHYKQMKLESQEIAHNLTQTLIQQLNFPRLVKRVYQDDYRIFIEVGAGSNCSRWIKNILKSQEHATVSLHRRNSDDFTSLIKALAKLVSHRVQLDLAPLYSISKEQNKNKNYASLPIFDPNKPVDFWQESTESASKERSRRGEPLARSHYLKAIASKNPENSLPQKQNTEQIANEESAPTNTNNANNLILWQPRHKFKVNNTDLSQAHSTFINREQTCLENSQKMLQTQIALLQKTINTKSD